MDLMLLLMAGLGLAAVVGVLGDNDDGSEEDATGEERFGTEGDDTLYAESGGSGDDTLNGLGGNDTLGSGDRSHLFGGAGGDLLFGGDTATAHGDDGDDQLDGEDQASLYGGAGNDDFYLLDQSQGWGDAGNDTLSVSEEAVGHGGDGEDSMTAWDDAAIFGDAGNDTLTGYDNATLDGGVGDDLIDMWAGTTATGGTGADQFQLWASVAPYFQPFPETVITDFESGTDRLALGGFDISGLEVTQDGGDTLLTLSMDVQQNPTGTIERVVRLEGVSGLQAGDLQLASDTEFSNPMTPEVYGDEGALVMLGHQPTFLLAGAGDDTIMGTGGALHEIVSGAGDDWVTSDGPGEIRAGEGDDTVSVSRYGTAGDVIVYGETGDDVLVMDATVETGWAYGGAGADQITIWSGQSAAGHQPGDGAGDVITVKIDADLAASREAGMVYLFDPAEQLVIEIDATLTDPVTFDTVMDYDGNGELTGSHTSVQVGGIEVLRLNQPETDWANDPRVTIIRNVVFA